MLRPAGPFQYFIQIFILVRLYMYISVEILKNLNEIFSDLNSKLTFLTPKSLNVFSTLFRLYMFRSGTFLSASYTALS